MNKTMSRARIFFSVVTTAAILLTAGCGGGSSSDCVINDPTRDPNLPRCGGDTTAPTPTAPPTSANVATIAQLFVSSPQINTDGATTVAVTVFALDSNKQIAVGRPVLISVSDPANSAFLSNFSQPADPKAGNARLTNDNGQLTAVINVGQDKSNRNITVNATVDQAAATNSVAAIGTTLAISGSSALALNASTQLSIVVTDSAGKPVTNVPVTVTSGNANTIALSKPTTDIKGQILASVTGVKPGTDVILASSSGANVSYSINISANNFAFSSPASGTISLINTPVPLALKWTSDGAPVAGAAVNLSTTRGTITPTTATTDANGVVSGLVVSSTIPGAATITASSVTAGGPSASVGVVFTTTNIPSKVNLQADKNTVSANPPGTNANSVTLSAVVRDKDDYPVQGATVLFRIDLDPTSGSLTIGSAVTDINGLAKTQYVPTASSSLTDGVVVSANVANTTVAASTIKLTVGGLKLFVRIGTDNLLGSSPAPDPNYTKEYSAFVTDSAGNPVAGVTVQFLIRPRQDIVADPLRYLADPAYVAQLLKRDTAPPAGVLLMTDYAYFKGHYVWNGRLWEPVYSARCFNEDANLNGIMDAGEDNNQSNILEPGNVFSINPTATTNNAGYAVTTITYPKDRANWLAVTLKATAQAFGTEALDSVTFTLPVASADVFDEKKFPPGVISPYGQTTVCTDTN
jgi:hypothetical protein